MNIDEMKDRIARAEEIQRYTENRCEALEEENKTISRKANEAIADKLLITAKYNEVLNNLNQENDKLHKENAELKEALKGKVCKCMIYFNFKDLEKECAKAKDILQRLMENQPTPSSMYAEIDLVGWREVNKEAKQFLKEIK